MNEFNTLLMNKSNVFFLQANGLLVNHYCILANGNCPGGFTRSQGHLRALRQYAATSAYITPATFGSSKIQCHGYCGQYGQWVGDLFIAACCK